MKVNVSQIQSIVSEKFDLKGNKDLLFSGIQSPDEACETNITWIKPGVKNVTHIINSTKASGIICDENTFKLFNGNLNSKLFIINSNPKSIFLSFVKYIDNMLNKKVNGSIHSTAIIDENCIIGTNVTIGAYAVIGSAKIGDNTVIHDHVKIHDNVEIGKNCLIREFCSIGGAGFGYVMTEKGNEHIPHIGGTLIEDNVHLFPFCNVDRGTLGKTIIMSGTVIDHHVHLSHNTITGRNNVIAAGVILSGGSKIKDNCFIGVNTLLKQKCEIGSNVITGIGAVVICDIPDNEVWVGNPAKFLKASTPDKKI